MDLLTTALNFRLRTGLYFRFSYLNLTYLVSLESCCMHIVQTLKNLYFIFDLNTTEVSSLDLISNYQDDNATLLLFPALIIS